MKNKFLITKNKELVGKRAIRKAKAKEERIISEKLSQHEFQVMDTATSDDTTPSSQNQESVFLPTQEYYRVHKKEENRESELS